MSYVDRNESGEIIALYACSQRENHEFVEGAEIPPTVENQIAALEASVTHRWIRGAALGDAYAIAKIQEVDDAIAALGVRS